MKHVQIFKSFQDVAPQFWQSLLPQSSPFLKYDFLLALERSGCSAPEKGWAPLILYSPEHEALLFTFLKDHSYGEYIFDWEWAWAYQRLGMDYYPKLTSMIPFTPVTITHFLMREFDERKALFLLQRLDDFFMRNSLSSSHFLFTKEEEKQSFLSSGYLWRESMQYHFFNEDYENFEGFLAALKSRKAKSIRKERIFPGIEIRSYTKDELTSNHARQMYQFYLSTINLKNSIDYLNEEFFKIVFDTLKDNILYVEASSNDLPMAGSLFFYDKETLYGRYWGSNSYVENLHFELCYYQGIDFCLKHRLKKFEAGAQGEHKIPRGFRPVPTYSAHKMKDQRLHEAIENYISEERTYLRQAKEKLSKDLPFKQE